MTPEQTFKAKQFAISGYLVEPAENGGFIVSLKGGHPGHRVEQSAFTNASDLLEWLKAGHDIQPVFFVKTSI